MTSCLPELLKTHIRFHKIEGSTRATLIFKETQLGLFLRYLEERGHSMDIADLSMGDVIDNLADMKERGLAPASVQTRFRAIRAFLQWAVEWDIIAENPLAKMKTPKTPKVRKPFLSKAEFDKLISLCPLNTFLGARRQAMIWMFATTGMPLRELYILQIEDLDWDAGTIRVIYGKGQKERRVPFLRDAQRPMVRYLAQRQDGHPCLWVSEERKPLKGPLAIGKDMDRLFKGAGLKVKDRCHIFRRTWAANSVRQGIPRPYTQAIAGWATPIMLDRYTAAMEAEEGAIGAFEGFKPFG